MLCASLRASRRRVRRVAAHARRVPRGPHDRGAVRASVGQPARARGATGSAGARSTSRGLDLPTDPNGLPMHGNLRGAPFDVVHAYTNEHARAPGRPPRLRRPARPAARVPVPARRHDRRPARRTRPAPHDRDRADRASARCRSRSAGIRSSNFPACRAASGSCVGRACERVLVDERVIPTGERVAQPARARAARRPHVRRSLRARRPIAASRCAPARPERRAALRPDVSVRAALRAARRATSRRSSR